MSRNQLERLVSKWQKRLGLDAWDVKVDWETPAQEDCHASTQRSHTYDTATLYFDVEWTSWNDVFTERIVVHELLHLLTRDLDRVFASTETHMRGDVYAALDDRYTHEIEGLVDRLSYRLVEIAS